MHKYFYFSFEIHSRFLPPPPKPNGCKEKEYDFYNKNPPISSQRYFGVTSQQKQILFSLCDIQYVSMSLKFYCLYSENLLSSLIECFLTSYLILNLHVVFEFG